MRIITLCILSLIYTQAAATEITFHCQYKVQNENVGFGYALNVDVQRKYINYANWGEPSTIIDWGDRYIRWVQNQDQSVGIFVFDRQTSMMMAEVVAIWEFEEISNPNASRVDSKFGYYACNKKAF